MNVSECQEIVGCGLGPWNVVLDVRVDAEMWRTEKEFENLMSSWAIIGEENIPSHGSNGTACEGVYFSMTNIENSDLILRELLLSPQLGQRHTYNITSHPFIHSIIFNYTSNKNGPNSGSIFY